MGKRIWKKALALSFVLMLLCSSFSALAADEKIEHSAKDYTVIIQNADKVFIGNKKPVDWKVGDKYFLTYTVDSVADNSVIQSGLICTDAPDVHYPHDSGSGYGGMQYTQENVLCEKGYTYFLRFEVTEDGMTYIAAKAKGGKSEYISNFIHQWPVPEAKNTTWQKMTGTTKITNFGAWFAEGGKVNARLTHVRCYDEDGNDLGVYGNKALGVFAIDEASMSPKQGIDHTYNFSLKDASTIYFGSARETKSQTIFLEYTVKNVKAKDMTQSGVVMTKDTSINYPHTVEYGYLNYQQHTEETGPVQLVEEGATYFVRVDRTEKAFEVLVKRTLPNGTVDYFSYPHFFGTESNAWPMAGMWIGENCKVTADFVNCKAYDAEGNNLAITTNQKDVVVEHIGDLEDYSKCEAVYYCKENGTFISLDDECNASRRVETEEVSKMGNYSIRKTTLSLNIGKETEKFEYYYNVMKDKDGNRYVRLGEYDVVFHTRFMGGDVVETVKSSAANGFKVEKPSEPKEEGRTFKFWKTAENEEFDFDGVVTEATHLYASWEGEETWEAVSAAVVRKDPAAMIVIAASSVLVIGTAAGAVVIGRGKKNGKK